MEEDFDLEYYLHYSGTAHAESQPIQPSQQTIDQWLNAVVEHTANDLGEQEPSIISPPWTVVDFAVCPPERRLQLQAAARVHNAGQAVWFAPCLSPHLLDDEVNMPGQSYFTQRAIALGLLSRRDPRPDLARAPAGETVCFAADVTERLLTGDCLPCDDGEDDSEDDEGGQDDDGGDEEWLDGEKPVFVRTMNSRPTSSWDDCIYLGEYTSGLAIPLMPAGCPRAELRAALQSLNDTAYELLDLAIRLEEDMREHAALVKKWEEENPDLPEAPFAAFEVEVNNYLLDGRWDVALRVAAIVTLGLEAGCDGEGGGEQQGEDEEEEQTPSSPESPTLSQLEAIYALPL
ncbi:hypothetical protein LQW54_009468 [Pestalotiopsis sp. IQ-011]